MRFDENFNVSLSLNPKREMIKVMKKYLLVSLLALLAFVGKAQEDNSDIVKVGDTMPSFTIVSDNGSKLQSASLKGKVILVNFFATWCPPCQKELAAVQQTLWPKYKNNKDFVLLVIGREHSDAIYRNITRKKASIFHCIPIRTGLFSRFRQELDPSWLFGRKRREDHLYEQRLYRRGIC